MEELGRVFVYSQSTTRGSQAFRPPVRPERRWRGSNPRQKDPSSSQGGLTSHCATDAPYTWKKTCVQHERAPRSNRMSRDSSPPPEKRYSYLGMQSPSRGSEHGYPGLYPHLMHPARPGLASLTNIPGLQALHGIPGLHNLHSLHPSLVRPQAFVPRADLGSPQHPALTSFFPSLSPSILQNAACLDDNFRCSRQIGSYLANGSFSKSYYSNDNRLTPGQKLKPDECKSTGVVPCCSNKMEVNGKGYTIDSLLYTPEQRAIDPSSGTVNNRANSNGNANNQINNYNNNINNSNNSISNNNTIISSSNSNNNNNNCGSTGSRQSRNGRGEAEAEKPEVERNLSNTEVQRLTVSDYEKTPSPDSSLPCSTSPQHTHHEMKDNTEAHAPDEGASHSIAVESKPDSQASPTAAMKTLRPSSASLVIPTPINPLQNSLERCHQDLNPHHLGAFSVPYQMVPLSSGQVAAPPQQISGPPDPSIQMHPMLIGQCFPLGLSSLTPNSTHPTLTAHHVTSVAEEMLLAGITWARLLPAFSALAESDRRLLLKATWAELFILVAAEKGLYFEPNSLLAAMGVPYEDNSQVNSSQVIPSTQGQRSTIYCHLQEMKEMLLTFQGIRIDPTEGSCLRSIVLFRFYTPGLQASTEVQRLQEKAHLNLISHCSRTYPGDVLRTNRFLLILPSPQQGDLRLSGPPPGQGAGGGVRTRDRRVPADLRVDSVATEPLTPD
ncbi:nuclear receptor subfamily 2 group e member 1-like [Plakobranchus ocellatus]|uniref:Nuclear receptor subfamily 2 group e member 1-like n=1 Tax=Plakobranchus ocellatus TaxID=259542 RepID=A0AAV4BAU9_9GAST|nr:nuclear receptor subfamily 2 group e member 1-like [Plakobranchus ocellatus]